MKTTIITLLLLWAWQVTAVAINDRGLGEVSLIPYYSVNNNLNTYVSVTNTTDRPKAIKVTFREGLNGYAGLSYNVYLNGYDTWTFVLAAGSSTVENFVGQPSVQQLSNDASCAPFLQKFGQQFFPFALIDGPQDLSRLREGFIEVIEMGELTGDYAAAVQTDLLDEPANCELIEQAWLEGEEWDINPQSQISPATGGLMVTADLINVAEGMIYSIPTTSLVNFFPANTTNHTGPGDIDLSLDAAAPSALVETPSKMYDLTFDRGVDAVSAVLMAKTLIGHFSLDTILAAETDVIFTQPTRRFYTTPTSSLVPYNEILDVNGCDGNSYGGTAASGLDIDRESRANISSPFAGPGPVLCGTVFVHTWQQPNQNDQPPAITASNNHQILNRSFFQDTTENGYRSISFLDTRMLSAESSQGGTVELAGLPVMGVSFFRFTNSNAEPGLLAQYGASGRLKAVKSISQPGL